MRRAFLLLMLLWTTLLPAQTGLFRGSVRDESTDEPIAYCNIYMYELGKGAVTDDKGFFSINRIPAIPSSPPSGSARMRLSAGFTASSRWCTS